MISKCASCGERFEYSILPNQRARLKYCPECAKIVAKDKHEQEREHRKVSHHKRQEKRSSYCHPKVKIEDPLVGSPYFITLTEYHEYKPEYMKLDGIKVFIDGMQVR